MDDNQWAIFKTLLYSSLFQFPLAEEEIWYYLAASHSLTPDTVHDELQHSGKWAVKSQRYYALRESQQTIVERKVREIHSQKKIAIARSVATYLSLIPSVIFIGISGSVAVGNAKQDDDIDLFIITEQGTLFITRLLAVFLLQLIGKRRKRNDSSPSDKICLNFFLDRRKMQFPESFHDLYIARELAQVYPLFEREDTYRTLFRINSWTQAFLPNAKGRDVPFKHKKSSYLAQILRICESIVRLPQVLLIRRHQSREIITNGMLAFHPLDTRGTILTKYENQLRHYSNYYKIIKNSDKNILNTTTG